MVSVFQYVELLMFSRGAFYLLGVIVVCLVIFTTAAKSPRQQCPHCREINRPDARFCAQCGHKLVKP